MRLPLIGGSYVSRSIIANAQRCLNYYPEMNPKDSPVPVTYYQRPGLTALTHGPDSAPVRGIWRASDGAGYCVIGQKVFYIQPDFVLVQIGTLPTLLPNPCSFVDNGRFGGGFGMIVDGSNLGWKFALDSHVFSQIVDGTGAFQGATKLDYIDTFILFNYPETNSFGSTHSNSLIFDPLYVASKTNWPDPLMSIAVNRHEILLIGALKTEVWYDAGNPLFPFAELPGMYIEHGTCATYSVATADISTYWLGQDLQGDGVVWRFRGYQCSRISNHALETAIRQMKASAGTISDAIGYTYQQDGHYFYVLTFPTGDETWVFDENTSEWHQRGWTDSNGQIHRDRTNCCANLYGKIVVGDWENGYLYAMNLDAYTDTVLGVESPISCIRTFPHITKAEMGGQIVEWDGKRIRYNSFVLDLETGLAPGEVGNQPAKVSLRWSDDRGRTWGQTVLQSSGSPGEYLTSPQWRGLGVARNRVFEIAHSLAGPAALNGAFIEGEIAFT